MRIPPLVALAMKLGSSGLLLGAESAMDFERDIAPIFAAHCATCHGPEKQKGKLRLDSAAAMYASASVSSEVG